jgi:hypothetical protein
MKSMSIRDEMLEMFATTVQAELNATLHVCESGCEDVSSSIDMLLMMQGM